MTSTRALAPLLLACLLGAGCASPEAMNSVGVRIASAFPGLSYVNGDPEEGTTTLASLPLLSYRTTSERPGYFESETWILPLLGRFAQTDRYVRLSSERAAEDEEQAQGPPPDWWDRERARDGELPRRRKRPRTRQDLEGDDEDEDPSEAPQTAPPAGGSPAPGPGSERREPPPAAAPQGEERDYLVLKLDRPGKIVKQLPQQRTEWDVLLGLIGHHAERPARVLVRPTSKLLSKAQRREGRVVYEVGDTRDSFRLLPLFSFRRGPEGGQFMFWPLLLGYEREDRQRYVRLFYFLKVPLED